MKKPKPLLTYHPYRNSGTTPKEIVLSEPETLKSEPSSKKVVPTKKMNKRKVLPNKINNTNKTNNKGGI